MKPPVSLHPLDDYQPSRVRQALIALLEPLGGMESFVRPGQTVLIKPNMLAGKPPEKAVTTHPEIVRQVILLARKCGGQVSVGDSPGLGSPLNVARKCGILEVIEETATDFASFVESVPVGSNGGTFHHLEVAREPLEVDVIINLPKLKTHQMMGLTAAVKNMFGVVVGMRKARLHLQAGTDKAFFAAMLLELADQVKPALSIVDGVVAMEGEGPGSGTPVPVGALLAGPDPLAVDTVAAELLGLPPDLNWVQKVARERGREAADLIGIELCGEHLAALRPAHFRAAKSTDVNFGLPAPVKNLIKNSLTARPAVRAGRCIRCGHCVDHCPPQAMTLGKDRVRIDYSRCIRCFCCQELCPHGALLTEQGLLLRVADFLRDRKTGG
ncbi:MAG TPA: DUF362 domain-containing protein [Desulfuromonadales bacterium]|nr:DUF362 domain-containing protein [Desulfuromonadales bacterium]